ncbi:hypothetical protein [Sphingomonas sp. NFR04]|uniref:hypothetical protein n=1 Tax=Sphingomonas sp. NFR04 TaxID=1566283 RepID=UPI000B8141E6|nr:hypothetical protein [Sphingomonas sp. NFR04]
MITGVDLSTLDDLAAVAVCDPLRSTVEFKAAAAGCLDLCFNPTSMGWAYQRFALRPLDNDVFTYEAPPPL